MTDFADKTWKHSTGCDQDPCICKDVEPTDDDLYNGPGVEGGIVYAIDTPGSLGENDYRL